MSLTLRHLNADTSWLITFGQCRILLDPWLFGSQSDYFRAFSTQEHAIPPSIANITRDLDVHIDAAIISHEFTDHCHEQTLRSLPDSTPIFATGNASRRIRKWNYFQHIFEIPLLNDRPEKFTLSALSRQQADLNMPDTVSVGYLPEKGLLALPALHGATCLSFLTNEQHWHALLYIPHGCSHSSMVDWLGQQSDVTVSVLLQGFHTVSNPVWLGGLLNYGCDEAAKLAVAVQARHWIATHDEEKLAHGLVARFLKRSQATLTDAEKHLEKHWSLAEDKRIKTLVHDVPNGESLAIDWSEI